MACTFDESSRNEIFISQPTGRLTARTSAREVTRGRGLRASYNRRAEPSAVDRPRWQGDTPLTSLFVMGPQVKHLDRTSAFDDLVDATILNIDTARTCAAQIPDKFLKRRRSPKGIVGVDAEKLLRLRSETSGSQTTRLLLRLLCEYQMPRYHQPRFSHIGQSACQSLQRRIHACLALSEDTKFPESSSSLLRRQEQRSIAAGNQHGFVITCRFVK